MKNQFVITYVELGAKEGESPAVRFVIQINGKEHQFLEWACDKCLELERRYSNIKTNQIEALAELFDLSDKPKSMAPKDYLPINEIMDQVEMILRHKEQR